MTVEVTAGFVCKSPSLSLLVPRGGGGKSSLSMESLFSTEGKSRSRAMVIEGWVAGLS